MVEGRFSKFLKKLAFSGGDHQYQLLERGELETLVSPGAGRETRHPTPHPVPPQEPVRALRAAFLQLARLPLVLERRCLHSNASSRFCSGPGARLLTLACQPILRTRN